MTTASRRSLKLKAATAAGISQTLADDLEGSSFDELLADAQRLAVVCKAERIQGGLA